MLLRVRGEVLDGVGEVLHVLVGLVLVQVDGHLEEDDQGLARRDPEVDRGRLEEVAEVRGVAGN